MNIKTIQFGKYNFRIFYKSKTLVCKYPREVVSERIRCPGRILFDHNNQIVREIIYPPELWFKDVYLDDPIDNFIIDLSNEYDFTKIEIEKKII